MPLSLEEKSQLVDAAYTIVWTALRCARAIDHGSTIQRRSLAVLLEKQAADLREELGEEEGD